MLLNLFLKKMKYVKVERTERHQFYTVIHCIKDLYILLIIHITPKSMDSTNIYWGDHSIELQINV